MADESWLALDADPEKCGKAMLYCQDASGSCVRTGVCSTDGQCFRTPRTALNRAARAIEDAAVLQPDDVADDMRSAANWLRQRETKKPPALGSAEG